MKLCSKSKSLPEGGFQQVVSQGCCITDVEQYPWKLTFTSFVFVMQAQFSSEAINIWRIYVETRSFGRSGFPWECNFWVAEYRLGWGLGGKQAPCFYIQGVMGG